MSAATRYWWKAFRALLLTGLVVLIDATCCFAAKCLNCGREVPPSSAPGHKCPYCGVLWDRWVWPSPEKVAENLVKSREYDPFPDGRTKCNIFLNDYARQAYNYSGFQGKLANQIADFLAKDEKAKTDGWNAIDANKKQSLEERLKIAKKYADQGPFVVAVWKDESGGPGHVAVIVKGEPEPSGKWGGMKVPRIVQAGPRGAVSGKLSDGFGPEKKEEIVIYCKRPSNRSEAEKSLDEILNSRLVDSTNR